MLIAHGWTRAIPEPIGAFTKPIETLAGHVPG